MNENLILDLDLTDVPEENLAARSGILTDAGKYHFVIDDLQHEAAEGKTPCLHFTLSVTAGPNQGRVHHHRLFLNAKQWNREKLGQWAKVLCLPVAAGTKNTLNWGKAIGRHFCAEIKMRPAETDPATGTVYPERPEIPFSQIHKPNDPLFAKVEKDPKIYGTYKAETDEFIEQELTGVGDSF